MTEKNKKKLENKERHLSQSFVGCRPVRYKDKTKYTRKGRNRVY